MQHCMDVCIGELSIWIVDIGVWIRARGGSYVAIHGIAIFF